jgi:hypothetical protein
MAASSWPDAEPQSLWLDTPDRSAPRDPSTSATECDRWSSRGGYDAVYYFGRKIRADYDQRPETFAVLARQFFETFPQFDGLRFSHRWGGPSTRVPGSACFDS